MLAGFIFMQTSASLLKSSIFKTSDALDRILQYYDIRMEMRFEKISFFECGLLNNVP